MTKKRTFKDWEKYYRDEKVEQMPWYHTELDQDVKRALSDLGVTTAVVLDLGTGPGTQAIALAMLGFTVVATDISKTAVKGALARAKKQGARVEFVQDNILKTKLTREFDFVLDRGCFHVMQPQERLAYLKKITGLIKPGGYLFLKTFCFKETMEGGPYRFRAEEIEELFSGRFKILSIKESEFYGTLDTFPKALFAVMKKI